MRFKTEGEFRAWEHQRGAIKNPLKAPEIVEFIPDISNNKKMLEYEIQQTLFRWLRNPDNQHLYPGLECAYHIPNGGKRRQSSGASLAGQGLEKGIPDVHLPVSRKPFFSFYLELKTYEAFTSKSKGLSKDQILWHDRLRAQGHKVEVHWDLSIIFQMYRDYLGKRILD